MQKASSTGIRFVAPVLVVLLWVSSAGPSILVATGPFGIDKFAHILAYGFLALGVGSYCRPAWWLERPLRTALLVAGITILLGTIDEAHQFFVAGRDASLVDWLADVLGAVSGAGIAALWNKHIRVTIVVSTR